MMNPFKEHRLISYNLSEMKDKTRYNARTAQNNADVQEGRATAGQQQQLDAARTTYAAASKGNAVQYNPSATDYAVGGTTEVTPGSSSSSGGGVIKDKAMSRLAGAGYTTAEEFNAQYEKSKAGARDTMSNTGQGAEFGADGRVIAGSGRLNAPKVDSRIVDTSKMEKIVSAGVTESDADFMKRKAAAEEYNNAVNEGNRVVEGNAPPPGEGMAGTSGAGSLPDLPSANIDSFLAGIPKEQQDQAAAVFGPLFDYLNKAQGIAGKQMEVGMNSINEIDQYTADYLNKQQAISEKMFGYFNRMNQDALNRKIDSAERTYQADQAAEKVARERTQSLYERAIRDQMVKNEESRKSQLLGLGISGGWRASKQTSEVIGQLSKGDKILSDLYTDAAFSEFTSAANMRKVEATYHENISKAYDDYDGANSTLYTTMMDRAGEIDKTIYDTGVAKSNAVKSLISDYLDSYGKVAGDFAKTVSDQNKYAIDLVADEAKANADKANKTWDQAMKYIDTYGTQNTAQLSMYEQSLGLAPGSLSNQKTIEELKMKKAGGGGLYSSATGLKTDIDGKRTLYRDLYPNAGPEEIDNLVYQDIYNLYGNDDKGRKVMRDVYSIMTSSPLDGASYRIYNTAPGSSATTKIMEDIQNKIDDRDMAVNMGPGELYNYLTKDLPEKDRYSDTEALQYMSDLGYKNVPNFLLPRSWETFEKK